MIMHQKLKDLPAHLRKAYGDEVAAKLVEEAIAYIEAAHAILITPNKPKPVYDVFKVLH